MGRSRLNKDFSLCNRFSRQIDRQTDFLNLFTMSYRLLIERQVVISCVSRDIKFLVAKGRHQCESCRTRCQPGVISVGRFGMRTANQYTLIQIIVVYQLVYSQNHMMSTRDGIMSPYDGIRGQSLYCKVSKLDVSRYCPRKNSNHLIIFELVSKTQNLYTEDRYWNPYYRSSLESRIG